MEWQAGESAAPKTGVHELLPKALVDMLAAWDAESERLVPSDEPPVAGPR
jgi:hypothetical protein